jgi:MFS family permease
MGFVRVHFIPYVSELGFSHLLNASANFAMALLGIIGALLAGGISDRLGRRRPMSATFALRGAAYLGFMGLALWPTPLVLYASIVLMGLSWSSTISLVSTTCTDLYGRRSQGSVLSLVFSVMTWGTALGAWIPGVVYDYTGTYYLALLLNLGIAWVASGLVLGLREWWSWSPQRVPQPVTNR